MNKRQEEVKEAGNGKTEKQIPKQITQIRYKIFTVDKSDKHFFKIPVTKCFLLGRYSDQLKLSAYIFTNRPIFPVKLHLRKFWNRFARIIR